MTYVLAKDYEMTSAKTGERIKCTTYHMDCMFGIPTGSSKIDTARRFDTKTLAEVYARNKLPGRGFKPRKVEL